MSVLSDLSALLGDAFADLGFDPGYGLVVASNRPDLGQFQCNGALPAAKSGGRNPREVAEQATARLADDPRLAEASVAGPGFINLSLTDRALAEYANRVAADPQRAGAPLVENPLNVVVDYAGPNVAKAMHVGHLRSTIIGDSLKRLLRFRGHRVWGDAHFGDWGLQMGMLIVAAQRRLPDLPYFDPAHSGPYPEEPPVALADLQEWYPQIAAQAERDEETADAARQATGELQAERPGYLALWKHFVTVSRRSQKRDFADLGVEFDLWHGESTVRNRLAPLVENALAAGAARESEGAVVVDVAEEDDKTEIAPLVVRTSRGAYLYSTTDLATIGMRVEEVAADLILYVVDARQSYHFTQVFRAARRTGIAPRARMEHIPFGTMNGKDGKPYKTRAGQVLALQDLIRLVAEEARRRLDESDLAADYPDAERDRIARQVGLAALKFGDLINNRASNYVFQPKRFTSLEGKTGPYLQMAAVRMASILAKAEDRNLSPGPVIAPAADPERLLWLHLLALPEALERAEELRAPNQLAEYAYQLAAGFSSFYEACHILTEADPHRRASWLTLVAVVRRALELLLDLLGIEIPDRM